MRRSVPVLLLLLLAPLAAHAELSLFVVNGPAETPLVTNSIFQLSPVEAGEAVALKLRVRNNSSTGDTITSFSAAGAGFTLVRPLPPQFLDAGAFMNATLNFSSSLPANYSANLQMNGITIFVVITVNPGAALTAQAPCQADGPNAITFGIAVRSQPVHCTFQLGNALTRAITINSIAVTGAGFTLANTTTPLTLSPGGSTTFLVQLNAASSGAITGALQVNSRTYTLEATGADAPLPTPVIGFGVSPVASSQQRQIRLHLPSASPSPVSGFLNLAFDRDTTAFSDDPAIQFLETNSRQVQFQFGAGQTDATFTGAAFVTLQTGTTSGRIRLTLSAVSSAYTGDPTVTLIMAPTLVTPDKTTATRFANHIEFALVGYDNTFSGGSMLFRFYDANGAQITAAMPADFTSQFHAYFAANGGGGAFKLSVQFPLTGDGSSIAAMEADLSNSAGTLRTGRLAF